MGVAVIVLAVTPAAAGAGPSAELEVRTSNSSTGEVLIAVPDVAAGTTLPADAFAVDAGQGAAPIGVQRVTDQALDLTVLIDVGSSPSAFDQVRGALVEFMLRMPTGARLRVADATNTQPFTTDRQGALDQVAAVVPFSPPTTTAVDAVRADPLARLVAEPAPPDRHQVVLVVTDRSDLPAPTTTAAVVDVISLVGGSASTAAGRLAAATGGIALDVVAADGALAATDAVASDLARLYRLQLDPAALGTLGARITLTTAGASSSVDLADATPTTSVAPTTAAVSTTVIPATTVPETAEPVARSTQRRAGPLIVALSVVALAAVGVAVWGERRRRTVITLPRVHVDVREANIAAAAPALATITRESLVLQAELRALDGIARLAAYRREGSVRLGPEVYELIQRATVVGDRREYRSPEDLIGAVIELVENDPRSIDGVGVVDRTAAVPADHLAVAAARATTSTPMTRPIVDLTPLASWPVGSGQLDTVLPVGCAAVPVALDVVETVVDVLDAVVRTADHMLEAEHLARQWNERYQLALDGAHRDGASSLVELIVGHPLLTRDAVRGLTGSSRRRARAQLRWLEDRELTEVSGSRRHRVWVARDVLASVIAEMWEPRPWSRDRQGVGDTSIV